MVLDVNCFEIYLSLGSDARNISIGRKKSKEYIHENNSQNCISYFICQITEGFIPWFRLYVMRSTIQCYGYENLQ